jgi:hypothetical protein
MKVAMSCPLEDGEVLVGGQRHRTPEGMQVVTTYSMSPYSEEERGPDHGH